MYNKINRFLLYFILVAAFALQLTVIRYITVFNSVPDLVMALVIFFGLFFGWDIGLETGFVAGLLKDIFSVDFFGSNTLTLALTGLLIGILSPKLFKESRLTQALSVFFFTLASMTGHYILNSMISEKAFIKMSEYMLGLMVPSAIYTSIFSLILFPILISRFRLRGQEEYL